MTALPAADQALLTDPQTSGGLLVSCAPEALGEVMAVFHRHGFANAATIGSGFCPGPSSKQYRPSAISMTLAGAPGGELVAAPRGGSDATLAGAPLARASA